ncbi:hypothetical protein MRB53_030169 [Persea americana]|uniref:Uncharacterized protein n=1 Tax=Persea americana TaxID=3435 RepID=A0ACC2KKU9_PERAE|nr:hypothetical protein MRB53_030169 [Persea americana]
MHLGKATAEDTQLKYLITSRSADGSGHPWTMVGHTLKEVVAVNENEIVGCLNELKNKKVSFPTTNFIGSLLRGTRETIFPLPAPLGNQTKPKPHCHITLKPPASMA